MPTDSAGFMSSLFDLSFSHLVTPKVIKFVFVVSILFAGLLALFYLVVAFEFNSMLGLITLVVFAPLGFLFTVIYTRIFLELIMALFKIAENTSVMAVAGAPAAAVRPD